ncbi:MULTISPECIES: hypothetical protein [Actinomyces]|uniref:hypothetical protein n=1 Tax=Actinomyces TaxID=1654 RepID=UPI001177393F|nr:MULTISPECIES: hypothetical protein [Actinomyces]
MPGGVPALGSVLVAVRVPLRVVLVVAVLGVLRDVRVPGRPRAQGVVIVPGGVPALGSVLVIGLRVGVLAILALPRIGRVPTLGVPVLGGALLTAGAFAPVLLVVLGLGLLLARPPLVLGLGGVRASLAPVVLPGLVLRARPVGGPIAVVLGTGVGGGVNARLRALIGSCRRADNRDGGGDGKGEGAVPGDGVLHRISQGGVSRADNEASRVRASAVAQVCAVRAVHAVHAVQCRRAYTFHVAASESTTNE